MAVVKDVLKVTHSMNDYNGIKQIYNVIPPRPKDINAMATTIARLNNLPYSSAVPEITKQFINTEVADVNKFVNSRVRELRQTYMEDYYQPMFRYTAEQPVLSSSGERLVPSNASTSATSATASASTATTQATNAATSASGASTSATNAASSASSASTSATAAAASYDSFDDRYLGPKATDPTVDNDGNPLLTGALYFNTVSNEMRVYTGAAWLTAYLPASGYVTLNGTETLTNKTLTAPILTAPVLGTVASGNISACTSTSMALVTPVLGTPTSGNLSNCTADGTDQVGYKQWLLPAASGNGSVTELYSGSSPLLECPCTDRITKHVNETSGESYVLFTH
jgi:hypothetical protein